MIRGSKDIAEAIDDAKREIIHLYRTHKHLTSVDVSLYIPDPVSPPMIEVRFEEYTEHG